MQRRTFLGAALAVPSLTGSPAQQTSRPQPARWLDNGLIDAGGSHEGLLFVTRRGGQRLDAREAYERDQSEDVMLRLKSQGVEVFHTHFYKGFGMAAEKPEMEDARRVAAIAHRHGLKVDGYLQWNTMMYETFFAEEPRARGWIQRDSLGKPILLTYGYQQSFRYRPCFANQEYLDYLKKIVHFAVTEVKADFIHFDNFDLNPEPDSCHCTACTEGFRRYLNTKYSPARRKERFGFENVDYINPPEWNAENPPQRMKIIFDPAIQEWIDFRCEVMARALAGMAGYIKSLNSEVAVECNPHGITGGNRAWEAGIDHARILPSTDVFWTEEENEPGLDKDGRLLSKIRSYKLARACRNILLTYTSGHPLETAECLAFNQTIGYAGNHPLAPHMVRYIAFYRRHREFFIGTEDVTPVGLLRSYPSIAYNQPRAQLSAVLAEQALIQAAIPFGLVFDAGLAGLSKYGLLLLPESECLSDEQLTAIRQFVANGGGLVAIGQAGLYDEWRRLRTQPGLTGLIDGQRTASGYEERVERADASAGEPVRKQAGKGRTVYLPALEFDGALPSMGSYSKVGDQFWKRPRNWRQLAAAIHWAASGVIPLRLAAPDFLVANLVAQPQKRRTLLHLVNYNARRAPLGEPVSATVHLPAPARGVTLYSPDLEEPRRLTSRNEGTAVSFSVPPVEVYSFAAIDW
ncbi:MAG: hypothetical protein NTY38_00425 [Acidobacteria bacterium]|nr:hypothetical protein [Acidobacteriota bacterium]